MGTNSRTVGPLAESVATELRVELARQGMKIRELARLSGVPYSTTRKCIEGLRAIDMDELRLLTAALHMTPSQLMTRAEASADQRAAAARVLPTVAKTGTPDEEPPAATT